MKLLCMYPVTEAAVTPYIGQPVVAITCHGDQLVGVIQSCADGHLYLAPLGAGAAPVVQSMKNQAASHPAAKKWSKSQSGKMKVKSTTLEKAQVNYYGWGLGRAGFGWGLGAGLGIALPLLALGALFAFPGFWI